MTTAKTSASTRPSGYKSGIAEIAWAAVVEVCCCLPLQEFLTAVARQPHDNIGVFGRALWLLSVQYGMRRVINRLGLYTTTLTMRAGGSLWIREKSGTAPSGPADGAA